MIPLACNFVFSLWGRDEKRRNKPQKTGKKPKKKQKVKIRKMFAAPFVILDLIYINSKPINAARSAKNMAAH